ncbi:hypothetical protein MCEREM21A_01381 [Sphingomonadaceae bacterium]
MAVWTNSAKRFYAHQLEVAVEVLDVCADVVRELVHQIEPFWIIVVLGHQPQLAVHKGATDVVFVRVVKPKRFGDVARRFVSPAAGTSWHSKVMRYMWRCSGSCITIGKQG